MAACSRVRAAPACGRACPSADPGAPPGTPGDASPFIIALFDRLEGVPMRPCAASLSRGRRIVIFTI